MERVARVMEYFWLALAILSSLWAVWQIGLHGWDGAKHLTWFPLICAAMFLYRRFMRKKMAQWSERKSRGR
jgi:hypothetical protein